MSTLGHRIAVSAIASSMLLAASVLAGNGGDGLPVGKATRTDVERQLGRPLRMDGPNVAEYRPPSGFAKIFVQYREGAAIVERIEVYIPVGQAHAATLAALNQSGAPGHRRINYLGKLEEYYALPAIVLTYRGADAASGVHRASYLGGTEFAAALAGAGGTAEPPVKAAWELRLHFDQLSTGPLEAGAFEREGVRMIPGNGAPGVYAPDPSMVLPPGRSKVLLLGGERTTALTFSFETPVRVFSLTRIGTTGGASVPTWTMQAFDSAGEVVSSAGEDRGLPPEARTFSVRGANIVRVMLSTDNRDGEGTWATWNSLPIAEFEFER